MPLLILTLVALALVYLARQRIRRQVQRIWQDLSPTQLWLGGALALVLGLALAVMTSGRVLLLVLPLLLLTPLVFQPARRRPLPGKAQVVETPWLRAELGLGQQPMDATLRQGALQGRRLSSLGLAELVWLQQQIDDAASQHLLGRFLQQEFPGWDTRLAAAAKDATQLQMSPAQAREILGVAPNASRAQIIAAHKGLQQRLPRQRDQGAAYLGILLDKARAVLLDAHSGQPR